MTEVLMPRLDPGMQSGKIVEWLKKEGETVQKGQPIVIIEGEKTTFEVEAPESGTLTKILAVVGDDIQVSQAIAVIGDSGGVAASRHQAEAPTTQPTSLASRVQPSPSGERAVASPVARRLAQEVGVDLLRVRGTGPGGRISREDVLAAVKPTQRTRPISRSRLHITSTTSDQESQTGGSTKGSS